MYHGGAHDKGAVHTAFLADDLEVVVATVAFGMGIDKSNIRRVIHHGIPATLEAYYQQACRHYVPYDWSCGAGIHVLLSDSCKRHVVPVKE